MTRGELFLNPSWEIIRPFRHGAQSRELAALLANGARSGTIGAAVSFHQ
jgi:hypothetical protein